MHNIKVMHTLYRLYKYSQDKDEVVNFRLKVINYHRKYGTKGTVEAFEVSRSTIYRWKKKV